MFVTLRRILSNNSSIAVLEIFKETQIDYLLKSLLSWLNSNPNQANPDTAEIQYYFEMELAWVLLNLANGPNEVVHGLLYDTYGKPD